MPRIMAIDYGTKRCGLAVTDELQIIATGLDTVETKELFAYLEKYFQQNSVEDLVVGYPMKLNGEAGELEDKILVFIQKFSSTYPKIKVHRMNETFTSFMASQAISQSGMGKKKRQDKATIDKVSAVLILQSFMAQKSNNIW